MGVAKEPARVKSIRYQTRKSQEICDRQDHNCKLWMCENACEFLIPWMSLYQRMDSKMSMGDLQRMEFKQAFQEFDKDGSGTISTKELLPVMRSMGQNPTEDEVLNLVIEYDVNGDGTIDFDEFLEMMRKQAEQQDNSAELKEAFKIFDRDGNGYIDAAELKKVVTLYGERLSLEEAEELLNEADMDGDGKLDFEEFVKMMSWDLDK